LLLVIIISLKFVLFLLHIYCVSEDKLVKVLKHQASEAGNAGSLTATDSEHKEVKLQEHRTSEENNAANMTATVSEHKEVKLQEHQTSEENNAANFTATLVGIVTGLTVVMAVIILGIIALARKRGRYFAHGRSCGGDLLSH
jgi:hypothetical protein